ncbi:MAG: alpha/beta hydrolase [Candidatus Saccharibacteria bacterium]
MYHIDELAEPFALPGDNAECLLIHGLTGSPSEVRPLAEYLNKRGYTVRAPLLPGHGTSPQHLNVTEWHEWYEMVQAEAENMIKNGHPVIPIGFSVGGLLALEVAKNYLEVDGVITINAPIVMSSALYTFAPLIKLFYQYVPKHHNLRYRAADKMRFAYDSTPVNALVELRKLKRQVMRDIDTIDRPVLIVQSRLDDSTDPRSAPVLHKALKSKYAEILWLQQAGHIDTINKEIPILGKRIVQFIEKILKQG